MVLQDVLLTSPIYTYCNRLTVVNSTTKLNHNSESIPRCEKTVKTCVHRKTDIG